MSEDELMAKFEEVMQKYPDDPEFQHLGHDALVSEYFKSIGYLRFAEAYDTAEHWYA